MIRPVLTELALFLAPFAIYAVYLWATRAGVLHPESWPLPTLMWLTIAALAADGRQLHRAGAVGRRAAGLGLRPGAHRERQARPGDDEVTSDRRAPGCANRRSRPARRARPRRRGGARGRRRGAQRAARPAAWRHRHRDHRACRSEVMRRAAGRRLQAGADRHRPRHRHGRGRGPPVRGDHACARTSRPSGAMRRCGSGATGSATPSGATSP